MKLFFVLSALLAVACGYQTTWTLNQLSEALQSPVTDPTLIPHLEHALDQLIDQIYAGQPATAIAVTVPALDLTSWNLNDLSEALQNPNTDPALVPHLEDALNQMMEALISGQVLPAVAVAIPAMDVSLWSLNEISDALQSTSTNAALVPYLEHALNQLMQALMDGHQVVTIAVATPAGLLPTVPVAPETPEVVPAEVPVVPEPVAPAPSAPASPLVQIIVNVNAQTSGAAPSPSPAVTPEVADKPQPIIVVDEAQNIEHPVVPAPVIVDPVDIIAVNPIQVNPIDQLHPVPVVTPVIVAGGVAPMV